MTIQHSAITESDLHEPKGVSTATDNKVATAVSSAVSWLFPIYILSLDIVDITADDSYFLNVPYAGDIISWQTCISNAITTGDASLTLEIATVAVTDSTITITQSGSAAGDVDTATPSGALSVAAGGSIEIIVSGSNATATHTHCQFLYQRTA